MTAARRRLHPLPAGQSALPPAPLVVKRRDEIDDQSVEREAEVLRALAGGPVVELVDCRSAGGQVEMTTVDAGSSTLADAARLPARTVLRAAASACRSVVALHRAGWGHGAIDPDHVVVGGRGRTTLCSLGRARPLVAAPELVTVDRRATFAVLLYVAEQLEAGSADRVRRRAAQTVRSAVGAADQDLLDVAAEIETALAGRLERRRPSTRAAAASTAAVAAATLLAGAWTWSTDRTGPAGRASVRPTTAPAAEVTLPADRVTVGRPGDEHVVVDLDCDGDDELLLLRPSTGELFVAPRVPDGGRPVRTVPVGHLPGATTLTTSTAADGCALPLAAMPDGSTVPVDVGAVPAPATAAPPTTALAVPTTVATTEDWPPLAPGPSTPSPRTPPPSTTRAPVATGPTAGMVRPRPVPVRPPQTAPPPTDPPYEYPVGEVPAADPGPTDAAPEGAP